MDETQRNLLGGFGVALMLGGIAWAATWVFDKPRPSHLWLMPAVALVVIGATLAVVAWRSRPRPVEDAHSEHDKVTALRRQLSLAIREGLELIRTKDSPEWFDRSGRWTQKTWEFLEESLLPKVAGEFQVSLVPHHGGIRDGLRVRVAFLENLLAELDPRMIMEDWQP